MENVSQKVLLLIWICSLIIIILHTIYDFLGVFQMLPPVALGVTFVAWYRGLKKKG